MVFLGRAYDLSPVHTSIMFSTQVAGGPFLSFPPSGERAALNEAALRRRSRRERLGWGEQPVK